MKSILTIFFSVLLLCSYAQTKPVAMLSSKQYPSLKAVLVVGTDYYKKLSTERIDSIAAFLKRKGVKTYCFYDTASHWSKIKEAAQGAHFFIYEGHGSEGGGLNIASGGYAIEKDLKLAKNAVVGFQSVCYGAGSSASDDAEISLEEAVKRVSWYAGPFFKAGAGCYFANNWNDGVLDFLRILFAQDSSKRFFDYYYSGDTVMRYSGDATKKISIRSSNLGGTTIRTSYRNGVKKVEEVPSHKSYEIVLITKPDFSLIDITGK